MYLEAFRYVLSQPDLALALTGTFVILSQVKINVTNAYAGSIAWSNFFSRLTHSHPGRVVWLVFNVLVALLLMEIGVYKALEQTLALYSNVAIAWVGALVADLVINKPLGLRPQHMEFKRAHLYDINPVGVGAMTIATIVSISAFYGLFGPTAKALAPFVALLVALRHRAADRLGDRRQILHRAQAEAELAEPRGDPVLHLRAFVRARGHGVVPGLCRPDLLAVLLARRALPRSLQAACADPGAGFRNPRQAAAAADLRADQFAARALSRRVRGFRRAGRADARHDLSADLGDRSRRQSAAVRRAVEGVLRADHHHRRGRLAVRAGAAEPARGGRGNQAADHAADPGNRRPQAHRRRIAARQGSRGIRQSRQEPLCRRPEPRTALAAERHLRLRAIAGAGCEPAAQAARPGARGPPQRRPSVGADRRHSRHLQDRGRPAVSVARRGSPQRIPRSAGRHVPPAGRRQGHRFRLQAAGGAAGRGLCRRKAAAPDPDQPAVERHQVHPDRQRAVRRCTIAARSPSSR